MHKVEGEDPVPSRELSARTNLGYIRHDVKSQHAHKLGALVSDAIVHTRRGHVLYRLAAAQGNFCELLEGLYSRELRKRLKTIPF